MRRRFAFLVAAALAAVCTTSAMASDAGGLKLTPVKSTFPERTFVLSLPRGTSVGPAGIRLTENGEAVDRLAVAPTSFGGFVLLIDTSLSMKGKRIEGAMQAARVFARQRQPHEKLAIVTFDAEARVVVPFTTDPRHIDQALATTPTLHYLTRTYDGLAAAARLVASEDVRSPAVVLISDGEELGSRVARAAALESLERAKINVFSVGLATRPRGTAELRQLAYDTGGTSVRADSPEALVEIYEQLGYELSNGYLVQYRSFALPKERVRVTVTVPGLDGSAGTEYRAPALAGSVAGPLPSARTDRALRSNVTMLFVVLLTASLLGVSALALLRPSRSNLRRRLGAFVSLAREEPKRQSSVLTQKLLASTDQSLGRTRWWDKFKHQLVLAEIPIPAEQIVALTLIVTLFVGWLAYLALEPAMAIFALATPFFLRWFIFFRAARQRLLFGDQLADNLQVISSALRAGHSLVGALSVMVEEAPEPSRREFRRVVTDEQLGVPIDESLQLVGERMQSRDLEQVALVAALQRESGGNAADVLDQVAENIRERAALRRLVRTLTAQGRLARWIVSLLPVGLMLIIMSLNRDYMEPLISETSGKLLLGFAGLMIVMGSLVIRRIVDIKV